MLIRKTVFCHESKYVASLPYRYRMQCAYFFFFSLVKIIPSTVACCGEFFYYYYYFYIYIYTVSVQGLFENCHQKLPVFLWICVLQVTDILIDFFISVFSLISIRKFYFSPNNWTRLSWINKIWPRKHISRYGIVTTGETHSSQFLFFLACFLSPINHNNI